MHQLMPIVYKIKVFFQCRRGVFVAKVIKQKIVIIVDLCVEEQGHMSVCDHV
jgi:hypothetical protein